MSQHTRKMKQIIQAALMEDAEEAKETGSRGYMARVLTQATLPHKKVTGERFTRSNGTLTLTISTTKDGVGLPYGTIPRLLLSWLTTEAVVTKSPEIVLGKTLNQFMGQLQMIPTGGRWGSITRLREQISCLFSSVISCSDTRDAHRDNASAILIAKNYDIWWHPKENDQSPLWNSTVTLNQDFFDEIISRPIPVDMQTLNQLKKSPMALDIYCWLTYRMSYLKASAAIPWEVLEVQFGADYLRSRDFKLNFLKQLRAVLAVYPEANIDYDECYLILKPSYTHIKKTP